MSRPISVLGAWLLLLSVAAPSAFANEIPTTAEPDQPLVLGLGVVYRDKVYQAYDDDEKWQPIPLIIWENDKFFFRATTAGWKLVSNETWEVAAIAEFRGDGYDSDDATILEGMSDRDQALDAGAHLIWRAGNGFGLKALWVADVSNKHEGYEIRGEAFYAKKIGNFLLRPSISVVQQSDDTVDYYYGVRSGEAIAGIRPFYRADEETNFRAQLAVNWNPGGSNWQILFGGRVDALGDEIDDSPIVSESTMFMGFFAAGYRF